MFGIVALPSAEDSSTLDIFISPENEVQVQQFASAAPELTEGLGDTARLAGAKVIKIQGQDPWEYINMKAMERGGYRDQQVRINNMFTSSTSAGGVW